jgi:hypothetical protein
MLVTKTPTAAQLVAQGGKLLGNPLRRLLLIPKTRRRYAFF